MSFDLRLSRWTTRQAARSRFKLAVSLGFVIVASASLMLGVSARSGIAEGFFGAMPDVFGGSGWGQQPVPQASIDAYRRVSSARLARRHVLHVGNRVSDRPGPVRFARQAMAPMPLARQSLCVRLCDGFAFPVGAYHGSEDNTSHEATCRSECPGARTALYIAPAGAASLAEAADARSGVAYSELPDAFHYTTVLSDACSCHATAGGRIASVLRDFTLRRGDAVMTRRGFQVFHGGSSFPYKRKDFVALARSPDIRKASRAAYRAIERASLIEPRTLAQDDGPHPDRAERQASR